MKDNKQIKEEVKKRLDEKLKNGDFENNKGQCFLDEAIDLTLKVKEDSIPKFHFVLNPNDFPDRDAFVEKSEGENKDV